MEAFGFASSVIALITIAAQVGTLLSTYISEVKDAPEMLSNLLSEISSLTRVLTNLKQTIDSEIFKNRIEQDLLTGHKGEHWRFVNKVVDDCLRTLRSLQSEWESRSEPHRKRPRLVNMAITQFRLASEESNIRSYRLRILTAKDAINISLMALSVTSQFELQNSVDNLIPRLDETSEKINEVLNVLNERFQGIHLNDDMETISIARRVVETASDIVSMASSTAMSVTDRTETQSVIFPNPDRQSAVMSWVESVNSSASHELMNIDLSRLGCEALLERGLAAYAEKSYRDAEALLEHYLVIVQSEELQENQDKIFQTYLKLCTSCLQQGKLEKMHEKLISATDTATTPTQTALLYFAYSSYYLSEQILNVPAAESVWKDAASCLISAHGSLDNTDSALFDQLKAVKLEIVRHKGDPIEYQFWSTVVTSKKGLTDLNSAQRDSMKARRLRKPTVAESREIAYAIGNGDLERIQKIITDGINIMAFEDRTKQNSGYKCLHLAVNSGQEKLVEFFLQNGADPNQPSGRKISCPLTVAAGISDQKVAISIFKLLLQNGAVIRTKGQFALHKAVRQGNLEIVRMLLKEDPDTHIIVNEKDEDNWSPLVLANRIKNSHDQLEVVKLLVQAGARVNDIVFASQVPVFWTFNPSSLAYQHVIQNANEVNLKFLHPFTNKSLLHHGYNGDYSPPIDLIPFFISQGLDINLTSKKGETPLISALKAGSHEAALKFIELGCDVNASRTGLLPLFYALNEMAEKFNSQLPGVASVLLDKGAVVRDIRLHGAIRVRDEQLVERLIKAGVDVDRDNGTMTPLAFAGNLDPVNNRIIKLLEEAGATTEIRASRRRA